MGFELVFLRCSPLLEWSVCVRYPLVFNKFVKTLSLHIILQLRIKILSLKRTFQTPINTQVRFRFLLISQ